MILLPLVLGSGLAAAAIVDDFASIPRGALSASPAPGEPLTGLAQVTPPTGEGDTVGWDGSLNVGASKTDGNADVENYSVTLDAVKEVDIHRFNAFAGWFYAATEGVRTQRRAIGSVKYDQFFAEKTYFWANTFAETNEQALVDLRWSAGGGLGHQFRDDATWSISAEVGLAYFDERFDTGEEDNYLAARGAWKGRFVANEQLTFRHTGEVYPSLEDSDDVYGRATTAADVKLTDRMNASAQWLFVWDNTPAANQDRIDNLYLLTIGWTF